MEKTLPSKKWHPIVMLDYVPRFSGHFTLCIVILLTLIEQKTPISPLIILFLILEGVIWPNFALFLSANSRAPKQTEYRMLFFDSLITCIWVPLIQYNIWPFVTIIMATLMTNICVGGLRLGVSGLLGNATGLLIGSMLFAFRVNLESGIVVTLACGTLIIVFSGVTGYMTYLRARATKQIREKLKELNLNLETSLDALNRSKAQLVQSEKMAGVGQLIAGISHEINTPAGAIASAIEEINADYVTLLKSLVHIVDSLESDLRPLFSDMCNMTLEVPNEFNTMEIRTLASGIQTILAENDIENARMSSRNLASVGFSRENLTRYVPLLKSSIKSEICESIFMLGMTRIHTRDIKIAIDKIIDLVRALKLFSRSDQGKMVYTDFQQDLDTTLAVLKNRLKQGIHVTRDYAPVPQVECVAERLNQVWLNMINNAIEAMKGKGNIIIRLRQHDHDHVRVEFEDNGPGIPSEVLPRIFEAYYTTKPKGEGTGLGLYISDEIVRNHHGKIDIDTSEKGTIFKIIIPLKGEQANE